MSFRNRAVSFGLIVWAIGAVAPQSRAGTLQVIAATAGIDRGTAGLSPNGQVLYGSFSPVVERLENDTLTNGLFEWTASSGVTTLPYYMLPNTGVGAVRGSSYDGSVLVGQAFDGWVNAQSGQQGIATGSVKWTSSGVSQVLPVGTNSNRSGVVSRATAISDDGTVIAGYTDPDNNEAVQDTIQLDAKYNPGIDYGFAQSTAYSQGFLQSSSGTVVLKDYGLVSDGRNVSRATVISPDGKSAYGFARDGGTSNSDVFALTRWDSSGNPTLLAGGFTGVTGTLEAQAASANGNTLIGSVDFSQLFIWTASGGLGEYPSVYVSSDDPLSINGAGTFAVGTLGTGDLSGATLPEGAAVFIGGTSVGEPLATYLTAHGVNLSGFTLDTVDGLSRDGGVLSGTGHYTGQSTEYAWIVTVPEPSSLVLIGAVSMVLGAGRKWRTASRN
jgi:hypothetical protein